MLKTRDLLRPALEEESLSDAYLIKEVKNGSGDAFRILSKRYNHIISYHIISYCMENMSYKCMAKTLNKSVKSIDNAVCRIK